jgi:hypothetical protein
MTTRRPTRGRTHGHRAERIVVLVERASASANACRTGARLHQKAGGHKVYLRTGEYEACRIGEIFIDMHRMAPPSEPDGCV